LHILSVWAHTLVTVAVNSAAYVLSALLLQSTLST